ncbi:MAG: hypothetical protein ACOC1F_06815 [Myxococcota bacterium]
MLRELGLREVRRHVSLTAARALGTALELAYGALHLRGEPRLTRFLASAFARSHWYDMTPAKRDFGYHIRVPMDVGTHRTVEWLRSNVGAGSEPASIPYPGAARDEPVHDTPAQSESRSPRSP